MKAILFSDLHLGIRDNSEIWLEASMRLVYSIIKEAKRRGIKNIIFAGDFFHDRKHINSKTLHYGRKFIEELKDFNVYLIPGNHDIFFKNSNEVMSVDVFKEYKHVTVLWGNYKLDNITMIPWGQELPREAEVVIGHFEINGFVDGMPENKTFLNKSDFKEYKKVFSGHWHTPKTIGNITYLGSPMQFTFADVDSKRGFYILDGSETEFIEFNDYPKYIILDAREELNPKLIEGNIVKVGI